MSKTLWRRNQRALKERGLYTARIDGDPGRKTAEAVEALLSQMGKLSQTVAASAEELRPERQETFCLGGLEYVGRGFSLADFAEYLAGISFELWKPDLIVVHHTAAPSLVQRPNGFEPQHMHNLAHFYAIERQWSAGPHLFVDEDQVWVFNPVDRPGIHAVSFNRTAIGIEMLGDYDTEDPTTGRGLHVIETTCKAIHLLCRKIGIGPASSLRFHRDDPRTSKTCPGRKISKQWFLQKLMQEVATL